MIEIKRNLKKKLPRGIPAYEQYFPQLKLEIVPLPSYEEIQPYLKLIVAKDAPVLCSAKLANADYLITGDKKDFGKLQQSDELPYKIIWPIEFVNSVLPGLIKKMM